MPYQTGAERAQQHSAEQVQNAVIREVIIREASGHQHEFWFGLGDIMNDLANEGHEYLGHFVSRFEEAWI